MTPRQEINVGEMRSRGMVRLKEDKMFSMWVKTACCNLSSDQLRGLADIIEKYARGYLLFTTRQIPIIVHVHQDNLAAVQDELAKLDMMLDRCGPTVRNVNVCYDDKTCPEALTNSLSLGEKLDNFFHLPGLGHKIKMGVAGCPKDCIISRALNDISFVAVRRNGRIGYDVSLGGRLGVNPFLGVRMAQGLGENECVRFVENYFDLVAAEGKHEERAADVIKRLGAARVTQILTKDLQRPSALQPIECAARLPGDQAGKVIVRVRATCGEVTAAQLRTLAGIADRHGRGTVHFAVRGAPEVPGVEPSHLPEIRDALAAAGMSLMEGGVANLQSCFGAYCTESQADPYSLLRSIEKLVGELGAGNLDIKISASGCPNSCGTPNINDIGFYGVVEPAIDRAACNGCELCVPICKRRAIRVEKGMAVIDDSRCAHCGQCLAVCPFNAIAERRRGFAVLVGGREGTDTRLGQIIAEFVSEEEALRITRALLTLLMSRKGSAADVIDEIGVDWLRTTLLAAAAREQK